jgi:hypothetical protein
MWERAGFRIQDSGFRSQNEEHLLSADCLLFTADCLLHLRGSSSWRDCWRAPQSATRCHRGQWKEKLVILKNERKKRGYL